MRISSNLLARNRIIAGAAKAFSRKSLAQASVEDILREAEVSRRTFYKIFADKEAVLDALHEQATALFLDAFRDALAGRGDFEARIARCIDTYLQFGQSVGPLLLVLQGEAQRHDSRLAPRRRALIDELVKLFARAAARERKHKRKLDPLLIRAVLLAIDGLTRSLAERGRPSDAEVKRARAALLRIATATLSD